MAKQLGATGGFEHDEIVEKIKSMVEIDMNEANRLGNRSNTP